MIIGKMKSIVIILSILNVCTIYGIGYTSEFYTGRTEVLNMNGNQFGLRMGIWTSPYLELGFDYSLLKNASGYTRMDFNRYHMYVNGHLRIFKNVHPYLFASFGKQKEPYESVHELLNGKTLRYFTTEGGTVKIGLAFEYNLFSLAIETGGGSMGSGHVETNVLFKYAIIPIPKPFTINDFRVVSGIQNSILFIGPYRSENSSGFDIIMDYEKDGEHREYNVGIFFTDYLVSTGCFSFGTGWRKYGTGKLKNIYLTPGIQVLLWAEGYPDPILPAGSLGLGFEYPVGLFNIYANTRTIVSMGTGTNYIVGTTYSYGVGLSF